MLFQLVWGGRCTPKGPSTHYLRTLVPESLNIGYLDPLGKHCSPGLGRWRAVGSSLCLPDDHFCLAFVGSRCSHFLTRFKIESFVLNKGVMPSVSFTNCQGVRIGAGVRFVAGACILRRGASKPSSYSSATYAHMVYIFHRKVQEALACWQEAKIQQKKDRQRWVRD